MRRLVRGHARNSALVGGRVGVLTDRDYGVLQKPVAKSRTLAHHCSQLILGESNVIDIP